MGIVHYFCNYKATHLENTLPPPPPLISSCSIFSQFPFSVLCSFCHLTPELCWCKSQTHVDRKTCLGLDFWWKERGHGRNQVKMCDPVGGGGCQHLQDTKHRLITSLSACLCFRTHFMHVTILQRLSLLTQPHSCCSVKHKHVGVWV